MPVECIHLRDSGFCEAKAISTAKSLAGNTIPDAVTTPIQNHHNDCVWQIATVPTDRRRGSLPDRVRTFRRAADKGRLCPTRTLGLFSIQRRLGYRSVMNLDLKSERLLLRPHRETDLEINIEMGTDPEVMRYVGELESKERIVQDMPKYTRRCGGGCIGVWCAIDRSTQETLGTAILLPLPIEDADTNWDLVVGDELPDCEIEIGYMLKRSAWGNGYATEATKRLLKFAFEETPLEEIVATTDSENTASQRVLEKCGLVYEGMRLAYAVQCLGYRITRQQWLESHLEAS